MFCPCIVSLLVCLRSTAWCRQHAPWPPSWTLWREPNRIPTADRAALEHTSIDPHVDLIVLGGRAQDTPVLGQIALGQRRHHAARTGARDAQAHRLPDRQRVPDPGILHEVGPAVGDLYHDVGPKAPHLEPPLRI